MRMIKLSFAVVFCLAVIAPCAHAVVCGVKGIETNAPVLCGQAIQGGMLYGETKGWEVFREDGKGRSELLSKNEVFVLGLDRDEAENVKISFCKKESCQTYSYKIKQRKYVEQKVSVSDKFIKYSDEVQKRIDGENEKIKESRAAAAGDDALEFMNFTLPVNLKKFPISGIFGSRRVFNGQPKSPHKGLDIAAPTGTPAGSIAAGKVIIASDMYMSGKTVFVSHGHGVTSAYLHLDSMDVKPGDVVGAGDPVGKIGATGRVSGAHLHLGIYWRQVALDPELLLGK